MTDAIVNITDAVPGTIRVPVTDLRKGDVVFDAFGREAGHLTRVTVFKHTVRTVRSDGLTEGWPVREPSNSPRGWDFATITIKRGAA